MNEASLIAILFGVGLALLGFVTGAVQVVGLRKLASRTLVPSDERIYLRNRYRRRLLTAGILVVIGVLIGSAYLSGMEARADAIGNGRAEVDADGERPPIPQNDKQFVRFWGAYWIMVIVLVFVLVALAIIDAWSSRRYWMSQYRQLKDEHNTRLRRDLEVLRQHKQTARNGGRFGRGS